MTNYNERLDEILTRFRNGTIDPDPSVWAMDVADLHHAKQAITSLIKELIEEAKPTNSVTQRGSVTVYGDLGERELNIINQFEQNLLKALEEV